VNATRKLVVIHSLSGSISSLFVNRFELFFFLILFFYFPKVDDFIDLIFSQYFELNYSLVCVRVRGLYFLDDSNNTTPPAVGTEGIADITQCPSS
jgi:hypothetical protein